MCRFYGSWLNHRHISRSSLKVEKELGEDGHTVFVKIHAPFDTLCNAAEEIKLVMPLKVYHMIYLARLIVQPTGKVIVAPPSPSLLERLTKLRWFKCFGVEDMPDEAVYCGEFRVIGKGRFLNVEKPDRFFSPAQRSMLVFESQDLSQ